MSIHEKRGSHSLSAQESSVLNFERPLSNTPPEARLAFVLENHGTLCVFRSTVDADLKKIDIPYLSFSALVQDTVDHKLSIFSHVPGNYSVTLRDDVNQIYELTVYDGTWPGDRENGIPKRIQSALLEHQALIDEVLERIVSEVLSVCKRSKDAIQQFHNLLRLEEEKTLSPFQKARLLLNRPKSRSNKEVFPYSSHHSRDWEALVPADVADRLFTLHASLIGGHFSTEVRDFQKLTSSLLCSIYESLLNQEPIKTEEIGRTISVIRQTYDTVLDYIEYRKKHLGISETDPNPPQTPRGYR